MSANDSSNSNGRIDAFTNKKQRRAARQQDFPSDLCRKVPPTLHKDPLRSANPS